MDVLLTAACCCLVPTPVSCDIRAHNLLQAHTAGTSLLLLLGLVAASFLSLDYGRPIVMRPEEVHYSATMFHCLTLTTAMLLPISAGLYSLFKRSMQQPGQSRCEGSTDSFWLEPYSVSSTFEEP
jgi:hypothetical protein